MRTFLLALLALAPIAARAEAPVVFDVSSDRSALTYKVVHQLHTVEGTSKKVQGRAAMLPDGTVQVMLRAPVASFESGNGGRDEHMLETVEGGKFPAVTFKGIGKGVKAGETQKIEIIGELEFHGEKQRETVPVELSFGANGEVHVTGNFAFSLDSFHVERPALLLVKIEDECRMTIDLALVAAKGAP